MNYSYCVSCGGEVTSKDVFCSRCGAAVEKKSEKEIQLPTTIQQPRVANYEFRQLPYENIGFFQVYSYGRTYLNLLYLILLMPIGIFLFTYAVTCFSTFVGLIPIIIGLVLLYFFLISLPYLTRGYAWLGKLLVGVEIPPKIPVVQKEDTEESFWKKAMSALKKRSILYSFLYFLLVAMPFGIVTFTLVVSLIPTALGLLFSWVALIVEFVLEGGVLSNGWMYYTGLPNAFWIFIYCITPIVGFFLLTASLHLFNKLAIVHARIVAKMVQ
ncbi:MAG: hypothetical protein FK734_03440 [Asgard group archaeon]|nr:hypothetical protein [Asgard group archaeon]